MTTNANFIDYKGDRHDLTIGASIYREAAHAGMSVVDFINNKYPTDAAKYGSTFNQLAAQSNAYFANDFEHGVRKTTLGQMMDGLDGVSASAITRGDYPLSNILFPAVVLNAVEDRLRDRESGDLALFESLIAVKDTITNHVFERPVLNYNDPSVVNNPTVARSQPIAQLSEPTLMGTLTVSRTAMKINTRSIGMIISNEARNAWTLDLFSLSLARQMETEALAMLDGYINKFLTGDIDLGQGPLTAYTYTAASFDPASTSAANFTHKAYMKWLRKNNRKCNIDWIFCDVDAKLVLDNRLGRPTVWTAEDLTNTRLNQVNTVANARISEPRVFITEPGVLPANTVVGIDSRYALHKVTNLAANYQAMEELLMRKGMQFRVDYGDIVYRLNDDAFSVLTF